MGDKWQLVPFAGLLATMAFCVYMVVDLDGQGTPANYTNAAAAEVKDARGQVVLQGPFVLAEEDDDDIERRATLKPTGVDPDAAGEAEVEFAKSAPATQEVEFTVSGMQAGASFAFVIDGQELTTATADDRGRVQIELDVRMPGTSQPW